MRIEIKKANKQSLLILLPNWLIMNPITAFLVGHSKIKAKRKKEEHSSVDLCFTPKHLRMMFREIKRLKRKYRDQGWNLVEVQETNGDIVTVQF